MTAPNVCIRHLANAWERILSSQLKDSPIIQAFKRMQVALMILGSGGQILHSNHKANRLFGYDEDELITRDICDVLCVESVAELNAFIEPPAVDTLIKKIAGRHKNGETLILSVHVSLWIDADLGQQHALVLRDISKELKAQTSVRDELQRANNAIVGAQIGVFEYNPVDDTVIVSNIWRELLELDPSDDVDVQVEWRGRVHPEELDAALEPIRLCLAGTHERARCEYRLRSRDGTQWRWIRTDIAVSKRNEAGQPIRLSGAMSDISDIKATEDALRASVEQFRTTFESPVIGKVIVGLEGDLLRVNEAMCDLLGYSKEELQATDFQTLTYPDDLDKDLSLFNQLKKEEISHYELEKRYIRANGAIMWGHLTVNMIKDAKGQPEYFVSQIIDITERRRLSEVKSRFVSTVSHELRTPLTSVLGSLMLLSSLDDEPLSDEAQRLLFIAQKNGERLRDLVDNILDFEKFSAKQMRFALSENQLVSLVEESVMVNLVAADISGVRCNIICPDRTVRGFVDPKRFAQVMANLLSNATKFAAKGSPIDISVIEESEAVRITVLNRGDGIPASMQAHMFEPFFQATPGATPIKGGTGLGLSITKQIVEQTGGQIGFESVPGEITKFWFTIPKKCPEGHPGD
ncbi:PAS domain S-box protein [Celeribacter naphthalenivorans]|uniref:PAS domain S-box protein n=1 Tax=Celeribacter naphthalenivorans TaxID=1614694 RepID=UPI001CFB3636|nr:PAS domain S-box protein [Celeribacter naphthalenivorans]